MKNYRFAFVVACVTASLSANLARGFSITEVTLLPGDQITPSDELQIVVNIATPGQPPFLDAPTRISTNASGIHVDIFPDSGALAAIGVLYETVMLGTFPSGVYNYEVVIHPGQQVNWGTRTNRGIFSVVGGTPPPQLTLDEPGEGQQFLPGDSIPLTASIASDSGGPWNVEFFSGDQRIAESIPRQTVWWREAWGGKHLLTARATNSLGTTLISPPRNIQVGPGAILPVVSITEDWRTSEPCPICLVTPAVFTIHRTDPTNAPLNVYFVVDGTATPGEDYEALPDMIAIPAGERSAQLVVRPIDDQLVEGPEIVRVRLLSQPPPLEPPTYFLNVYAKESMAVIFDDEAGAPEARLDIVAPANGAHLRFPSTIELSALAIYTQNEVYGPVEFYADGEFVSRSLVTASTPPSIPGLPSVHTAYWTNPPVGEHVLSARTQLSFSQSITSPPVYVTVDTPIYPVVRIETLPPQDAQAPEFCALNAECAYPSFVIRRTGPTNADLRVYLSYSGTATPGVDYPSLPSSLVIPAGSDAAFLTLVPNDDTLVEGPETVIARFTAVPGPGYIQDPNQNSATITIVDNDSATERPIVRIEATHSIAEEDSIPFRRLPFAGVFRISHTGPTNAPVSVFVQYSGTATPGADYPLLPGIVTIPAGATSSEIRVFPTRDGISEGIETLVATISNCPPLTDPTLGMPCVDLLIEPAHQSATVFIRDDGLTRASLVITNPKDGANFNFGEPILIEATAMNLDGYFSRVEFFADGRKIGETNIEFIRAPEPGQPQTFTFAWRHPAPGTHLLIAQAADNGGNNFTSAPVKIDVAGLEPLPIVTVTAPDAWAVEPADNSSPNPATFRIRRFGPTNDALGVAYSISGTAENGIDYDLLPGLTTIPAGSRSVLVTVNPLADDLPERNETVVLRLVAPPPSAPDISVINPYRVGWPGVAAAVISDSPGPPAEPRCVLLPGHLLHVCFAAENGHNFRLEASSDLRNWETIGDTWSSDGAWHFIETEMDQQPLRFYRLTSEPVAEANE